VQPTVVGVMVCVGSCSGLFYAIAVSDGTVLHTFDVAADGASQFHGNPLVVDSIVVFATDQGRSPVGAVYALDLRTWHANWKVVFPFGIASEPAHDGGSTVYFISRMDSVLALGVDGGEQRWGFSTGWTRPDMEFGRDVEIPRVVSSPLYHDGSVCFVGRDSTAYCLDATTGTKRWSTPLGTIVTSDPVLYGNQMVLGLDSYELVALNLQDGRLEWRDTLPAIMLRTPSLSDSRVVFLGGDDEDRPRQVVAYDLRDRVVLWSSALVDTTDADAFWYVPRIHLWHSGVVVGSTTGLVVAYDISDGTQRWRYQLDGPIRGIGHVDSLLFVGTFEGMLHCLSFSNAPGATKAE